MQKSKEQKEKYAAAGLCLYPFVCWVEPTPPHTLREDNLVLKVYGCFFLDKCITPAGMFE